jgi:hypothetical protein
MERRLVALEGHASTPFGSELPADRAALQEMREKNIPPRYQNRVNECLKRQITTPASPPFPLTNDMIKYGDFEQQIPPRFAKYELAKVVEMLLRYAAIMGSGSQQWAIPRDVYDLFYSAGGARMEGFASPLNARFTMHSDAFYCSLFPVDRHFGSCGSFWDVVNACQDDTWVLNPPFVPLIMERVAQTVRQLKLRAFVIMPEWRDFAPLELLKQHYPYRTFAAGMHWYEAPDGRHITAKFATTVIFAGGVSEPAGLAAAWGC